MQTVSLDAAKADLSRLVERAAAGEEIVIEDAGHARAMLVPPTRANPSARRTGHRPLGLLAGKVWIAPDFDDPLPPDVQRALDGDDS